MKSLIPKFLLFFCIHASFIIIIIAHKCSSPDDQDGVCKSITDCPSLYNLLNVSDPIKNVSLLNYLKNSYCGFSGSVLKVCCPNNNPIIDNNDSQSILKFENDRTCHSPDNQTGECKLVTECPSIIKLLLSLNHSKNSSILDYLKKSRCGFLGTIPEVCCPVNSIIIAEKTSYATDVLKNNILPDTQTCGMFNEDRIFYGSNTDIDHYPWNVLLIYRTKNNQPGFYCGGSLISNRYVLTAAHCIKGKKISQKGKLISVRLGEYDIETNPDCVKSFNEYVCADPYLEIEVEEVVVHENYNPNDRNHYDDIALVRMKTKIQFNDFISPICLPTSPEDLGRNYSGYKFSVSGWGISENGLKSKIKTKDFVIGINTLDCNTIFNSIGVNLGEKQLCTSREKWQQNCAADSGGSLLGFSRGKFGFYAVGVLAFEDLPCNMKNQLRVYTKVDRYINWIFSKLKP